MTDIHVPGMRAIVTRFAAYVGDVVPVPSYMCEMYFQNNGGRPFIVKDLLTVSLQVACDRAYRAAQDNRPALERRDAFMTGVLLPITVLIRNNDMKKAMFSTGDTWELGSDIPFVEAAEKYGDVVEWVQDKDANLRIKIIISTILSFCLEPEIGHWQHDILLKSEMPSP